MSQIQGDPITIPSKNIINYNGSSPFVHDLSSKNDRLSLHDSPIPPEPLSPSSNNFLIKSQEISPIRAVCSKQSPELVDINASSNNFSGDESDNDSSELELREEIANENEKQATKEQIVYMNEQRQINSKMCLSPKKDISYNKSNCSMSQYYDTTSKYLSQALLEEQESYENNSFKENLNKSLNFISKQSLFINNKVKTFHSNNFLNTNTHLNIENNKYNNNPAELYTKNYYQNNFNWNGQCFNQGINMNYQQPQNFQNVYNNFNYPQVPFSFETNKPTMNVQPNMYFNYMNHVNGNVSQNENSMNFNANINNQMPTTDWNPPNVVENNQNYTQENSNNQQHNNNIETTCTLNEENFNQSNSNEKQQTNKSSKKSKKNKKRKNNKNANQNDKSLNNKDQSNEYLTELFGRLGWICSQCNNFNYETRNKCNRCGIPKNPKKISELTKKKKEQSSNNINGITLDVFSKAKNKKGDWFCPNCNNLNFGFRKACNRCQLPRNDSNQIQIETINHNKIPVNNNNIDSNLIFP